MLKKITIDNFKSLKRLKYDCAGLNLLTGMNGAGKSSFAQMLRLIGAASKSVGNPRTTIQLNAIGVDCSSDLFYCGGQYSEREIRFQALFNDVEHQKKYYSLTRIIMNNGERGTVEILRPDYRDVYDRCFLQSEQLELDIAEGLDFSQDEFNEIRAQEFANFVLEEEFMRKRDCKMVESFCSLWKDMRFVDAFRIKPIDVHEGGTYSASAFFEGIDALREVPFNAQGQNVAEYIYKSQGINDRNDLLDRVNTCLDWVSHGARLFVQKRDVGGREYFIEAVGFSNDAVACQYKPQNVGFGISYILPVLVTLLSAKPGSILIIENPEAHLHPRGQAEMGKLIAETVARGVQVFVETHSDHMINGVRVAVKKGIVKPEDVNIAFFERGPHDVTQADGTMRREIYSEVTNIKVDANGSLSEWPKDFMDEWGIQQMKLLRP